MAYGLYCRLSRRIAAIGMVAGAILLPWDVGVLWPACIERLATGARRGPLCLVRVRAMSGLKH
jgi:hypothetical protein